MTLLGFNVRLQLLYRNLSSSKMMCVYVSLFTCLFVSVYVFLRMESRVPAKYTFLEALDKKRCFISTWCNARNWDYDKGLIELEMIVCNSRTPLRGSNLPEIYDPLLCSKQSPISPGVRKYQSVSSSSQHLFREIFITLAAYLPTSVHKDVDTQVQTRVHTHAHKQKPTCTQFYTNVHLTNNTMDKRKISFISKYMLIVDCETRGT